MSTVGELPDKSWSEEKILELLNRSISGSATKENRLLCLDALRKRKTMKQIDEVMDLLLEIAKVHGMSTPESPMLIELISRLANSEDIALDLLLSKMVKPNDALSYCFARIIRNLEDAKKNKCIQCLLSLLMRCDSFTNITKEMYQTLVTIDNEDINKEVVKASLPYLRVSDSFKVVYAVKITSKLASEFLLEIESVMERALKGWYDGHQVEILKNICNYLGRIKDERTIPHLLQILKSDLKLNDITPKALASVIDSYPKAIVKIWEFLEKEKEHYPSILTVFAEMGTTIDLEKLFSVVDIDLSKWQPRKALRTIIIKAKEQGKPLLLEMVKDEDQTRYEFAIDCLGEIGVSIEEYSKVFEKSPILQVYEFFYKQRQEILLENLWKEQDLLGKNVKGAQIKKFEYLIQNFFSALGFVTLYVDPSGREGVDLVAFAPTEPYILIIGCTTSILKNDLEKMCLTLNEMEDTLGALLLKYHILPVVFISKRVEVSSVDSKYAGENDIAILTQEETTTLLNMLRTNRSSKEIIKRIEESIPPEEFDNPYE